MSKAKKMIFYMSDDCPNCQEAAQALDEIRKEEGVSIEVKNIETMENPPVTTAPSVCVVDEDGQPVKCVLGIANKEEFKTKVKQILRGDVVV